MLILCSLLLHLCPLLLLFSVICFCLCSVIFYLISLLSVVFALAHSLFTVFVSAVAFLLGSCAIPVVFCSCLFTLHPLPLSFTVPWLHVFCSCLFSCLYVFTPAILSAQLYSLYLYCTLVSCSRLLLLHLLLLVYLAFASGSLLTFSFHSYLSFCIFLLLLDRFAYMK